MNQNSITSEQLAQILDIEEGHFHDLKAIEIKPSKLTESVSAFANASGGEIYIGVDELDRNKKNRKWRGFPRVEDFNQHIQEVERLQPLGNHYRADFLENEKSEGFVLLLTIFKTKEIIRSSSGVVYIRRGSQKLPVKDDDALTRLKYDKGIVSFEDSTIDIDHTFITNSEAVIEFILKVIPTSEPYPWLQKQRLIHNAKPTVSGILLFHDEPQAALPKRCGIKVFRYKTRDDEGSRDVLAFTPLTIEGCVYQLVYQAVSKAKELIEDIQKLGKDGLESVTYPEETLHEIITNAVLHRDYSVTADIQIRIFDNRVEIESPGVLPGHITRENILDEQFARNPQIVRLINKFPNPPNKDVGEGLNTAFEAMRKIRLKEPEIHERDNSVLVIIRHAPLASPEETVMDYLDSNNEIANRIAREITGINSENAMKRIFKKLANKGMIEPVPGKVGFASAWRKKTDECQQDDGSNENSPPLQGELFS